MESAGTKSATLLTTRHMESKFFSDWATFSLGPSGWAILFTALLTLALPVLLHTFLYKRKDSTTLPTFLLAGPSGSGKTTLLTNLERGAPAQTHTSQSPVTVTCSLPKNFTPASNVYRSTNDPAAMQRTKLTVVDTPGHGKLRHFALNNVVNPQNLRGIIFVVDAATISPASAAEGQGESTLAESAEYLYDILLTLQKRYTSSKSSRGATEMSVMIAANKSDLFTALPAKLVKASLETELTKLRNTKSRGLLDSGIGVDGTEADDDEREVLGGAGEGKFEFGLMDDYHVTVDVQAGSATMETGDSADASRWWQWIADHL